MPRNPRLRQPLGGAVFNLRSRLSCAALFSRAQLVVSSRGSSSVLMPGPGLNPHPAQRVLLDLDIRRAKLSNGPSIGHEVVGRMCRGEDGGSGGDGKRQQQLIGEVPFNCGAGIVVLTQPRGRFVGNGF